MRRPEPFSWSVLPVVSVHPGSPLGTLCVMNRYRDISCLERGYLLPVVRINDQSYLLHSALLHSALLHSALLHSALLHSAVTLGCLR